LEPTTHPCNCQNKNIPEEAAYKKALRIIRDGHVNKYSNPRKAETTTPEYIIVNSRLKTAR
jgi:hypothetical protein